MIYYLIDKNMAPKYGDAAFSCFIPEDNEIYCVFTAYKPIIYILVFVIIIHFVSEWLDESDVRPAKLIYFSEIPIVTSG